MDYNAVELSIRLDKAEKQLKAALRILANFAPDKVSGMFICGEAGFCDPNGLPEYILVCPQYGADVVQVYARVDKKDMGKDSA